MLCSCPSMLGTGAYLLSRFDFGLLSFYMKRTVTALLALAAALCACSKATEQPVNVILETDIGNDVDDALALGLAYNYMDAGKMNLLAISINKEGSAPAEFVDIMNTFYGHPEIPIGIIREGAYCEEDAVNYAKVVVDMKNEDGTPVFARSIKDYSTLVDAPELYRKILPAQPDKSVVVVSIGFSTNLVKLLESEPDEYSGLSGRDLVAKKVKTLVVMAGNFEDPNFHEYNVWKDVPAAKIVLETWPTPVVASPFELGIKTCYPASSIENDFKWSSPNPIVEAYKSYLPMPYDRPMWDPTALMYAVEGDGWFTMSGNGHIAVTDEGSTLFTPDPDGDRKYMEADSLQVKAIVDHFVELIPFQPVR